MKPVVQFNILLLMALVGSGCNRHYGFDSPSNRNYTRPDDGTPALAPGEESIVYVANGDVYEFDRDSRALRRLTESAQADSSPVYSSDGARVFFVRETGGYQHIWSVERDGSNERQITTGSVIHSSVLSHSAEDSRLHFKREKYSGGLGMAWEQVEYDLGTGELNGTTNIVSADRSVELIFLGYDGRKGPRIVCRDRRDGTQLAEAHGYSATLSPNSEWMALWAPERGPNRIIVIALRGGQRRSIQMPQGISSSLEFCHCSEHLVCRVADDIYIVNVTDGAVERVFNVQEAHSPPSNDR